MSGRVRNSNPAEFHLFVHDNFRKAGSPDISSSHEHTLDLRYFKGRIVFYLTFMPEVTRCSFTFIVYCEFQLRLSTFSVCKRLVEPYREDNVDQTIRNGLRNIPETFQGNDLATKPPRLRLIVDIYISGR